MKDYVGYFFAFSIGALTIKLCNKCEDTKVYIEYDNKFHSTPVCDSISGFDREFYEEYGEILGSKEIDEKEVFYDQKYKMCNYCFSLIEIESRIRYINPSLK